MIVRLFAVFILSLFACGFSVSVVSRSIGINNLPLYSIDADASSNASRDTITLSTGSFPINIGEGDSIVIGTQTAFILTRVNDKKVSLSAPLSSPAASSNISIFRTYKTISAWEAAAPANLVTSDMIWKGVCYDDGVFVDQVKIQGSITDSSHYKWLTVAEGQRHTGIYETGARLIHSFAGGTSWAALNIYDDYSHIEWLEIFGDEGRAGNGIAEMNAATGSAKLTINNVMIHDVIFGLSFNNTSTRLINFSNSTVSHTFNHAILGRSSSPSTVRCINITMVYGATASGSLGGFRNCYVKNCVGLNYGPSNGYSNFMSCDPLSDFNVSSDGSAPGTHSLKNQTASACVRRLVVDSIPDFHLKTGSPCAGIGDSAGCSKFAVDLDGETRSDTWDAGADMLSSLVNVRPPFTPWLPPETAFLPAFPGAQGWGAPATGGRGGDIIHVTNLNATGAGSLRAACAISTPKIIVFDVSGVINLANVPIDITSNTTIFGQTSPAGITINNGGLYASGKTNIILRHIRIRRSADKEDGDCIRFGNGCSKIVIDHCSVMWCSDELIDISYNTHSISILNTNMSEPGYCSYAYGGQPGQGLGNNRTALLATGVDGRMTIWRSLFSQAFSRVPCMTNNGVTSSMGKTYELINNVYYNCPFSPESFYLGNTVPLNLVANWYRGPSVAQHTGTQPPKMDVHSISNYHYPSATSLLPFAQKAYFVATTVKSFTDSFIAPKKTHVINTAAEAYDIVTRIVGALPRDSADRRTVLDVVNGTGGHVDFCNLPDDHDPFITTGPAKPVDTDNDGIPDTWETAHGLNPNLAADAKSDMGGYNAIEVYANALSDTLVAAALAAGIGSEKSQAPGVVNTPALSFSPNPFSGSAQFHVSLAQGQSAHLSLFDVRGKKVIQWSLKGSAKIQNITWKPTKDNAAGVYYGKLTINGKNLHQRIVLMR